MFVKLSVLACLVAASAATWHGHAAWNGVHGHDDGQWHGHQTYSHHGLNSGAYTGDGDYHGEGLAESGAYGNYANGYTYGAHDDGQWHGDHSAYHHDAVNSGAYTGDGDYRGEGLAESGAYGDHHAHNDGQYYGHHDAYSHGVNSGAYTGDGDYHGEGLAESGAFGPAHHGAVAYSGAYGHHGYAAGAYGHHGYAGGYGHHAVQLPAGVDAHSCPNYPFCH